MTTKRKNVTDHLEKQRLLKRCRYAEIKSDPVLFEIQREKEKQKYKKKKEAGKVVSIHERSSRDQRKQRKKWKEASKRYGLKKKEQQNLPKLIPEAIMIESGDISETETHNTKMVDPLQGPEYISKKIRHTRYLEQKKRKALVDIIIKLKKENAKLRVRLQRLEEKSKIKSTIDKKTNITLKKIEKERRVLIKAELDRRTNRKLIKLVQDFYNDDGNSTIAPGKKAFIKRNNIRKQKRYLTHSLKMLYKKFQEKFSVTVSYGFFCKYRPFWVLYPKKSTLRDTCLCAIHCNLDLIVNSLYKASIIQERNSEQLLVNLICSPHNEYCLRRECDVCKCKTVSYGEFSNNQDLIYYQWVRQREMITTKKGSKHTTKTVKKDITAKPLELVEALDKQLPVFFEHCYKIETQYSNMKKLKETLKVNEAVIHVDFSENYALKFGKEVQSFHFGGSRKEVSLHTSVVYTFDFHTSAIGTKCACTISECLRHDASAIWAHLIPLIKFTTNENPFIDTIHFQSDSPTAQYRNKFMFHIITELWKDFPQLKQITWNYTEAGHGKGAPDGVGAVLKRTADSLVTFGKDIGTFEQFVHAVQTNTENVEIMHVHEQEILDRVNAMPKNLKPFTGTLSIHQVLWERYSNQLTFRKTNCFDCEPGIICLHNKHQGLTKIAQTSLEANDWDENYVVPLKTLKRETVPIEILSNITNSPKPSTSHRVCHLSELNDDLVSLALPKKKIPTTGANKIDSGRLSTSRIEVVSGQKARNMIIKIKEKKL